MVIKMGISYEPNRLREYAALSNNPIIYCLTYQLDTHRIAGIWAYQWLIDFVNTVDPVAFHPHSLRLIRKNLTKWKNPFVDSNDYQLFLRGVIDDPKGFGSLINQSINENRILYLDKSQKPWIWKLNYE